MTDIKDKSVYPSMLNMLKKHIPDAIYLIDPESSNILWVNDAGYKDLQMQKDEVLNHSVLSLQKDVVGPEQWKSIADAIRNTKKFTFMGRHLRKDGSDFPVEVNTSCFKEDGKEFFLSIARDISNRRAQEAEGMGREQQVWFAINQSSDGLWDWNMVNDNVYFSPQLKRMLGYGSDEMPPHLETWKSNVHPEDLARVSQSLEEHIAGKRERYEAVYRLRNRNGHYLWVHDLGCVSERNNNGKPIRATGMVKDITDYKVQESRLLALAAYDELTELRNRRECKRIFEKQIKSAQRNKFPLSISLFDLDFFKTVNDKFGHIAGDYVLKETAKLFTEHMRDSDYLFRWGGEEFLILCENTNMQDMYHLCEKLRLELAQHTFHYDNHKIQITASFGIATYPEHGQSEEELFLVVDSAMYRAKSSGRNCVCIPE